MLWRIIASGCSLRGTVAQTMCHRPQATRRDDNAVLRVARRRGCVYKGVD